MRVKQGSSQVLNKRKSVRMSEVAAAAKVSTMTVSRVRLRRDDKAPAASSGT